jgi:HPt (histidine-containing phosphotransfer) domain-containing protein
MGADHRHDRNRPGFHSIDFRHYRSAALLCWHGNRVISKVDETYEDRRGDEGGPPRCATNDQLRNSTAILHRGMYLLREFNRYHGALMAAASRSKLRQPMSATEVFDYRGTLDRLGGDTGLFADVVRFYLEDTVGLLQKVREAAEQRDATTLARTAHSLKGLSSTFGGREAVDLAWRIEQSAMLGDLDHAPVAELEAAVQRLSEALKRQLEANG